MNRAERRRMAKQKVGHRELLQVERQSADQAIDYATKAYSAALALALHDKLGFGKKRSQRFLQQVWDTFRHIEEGYLSLEDVLKTVQEDLGIDLSDE